MKLQEDFIFSFDNHRIFYRIVSPENLPRYVMLMIHGHGEHSGRYLEFAQFLAKQGVMSVLFDLRGHGQSAGRRGDVSSFDDYMKDIDVLVQRLNIQSLQLPMILFGHSLGGLIAFSYVFHANINISTLMLSSPFFGRALQVHPLKLKFGQVLAQIYPKMTLATGVEMEMLTHDQQEIQRCHSDPLRHDRISAGLFAEMEKSMKSAEDKSPQLNIPLYISFGMQDNIAHILTAQKIYEKATLATPKEFKSYPDMRHEPLHEMAKMQVMADYWQWIKFVCGEKLP